MSSIAIITARGGSKRIPKKNIKEFCGKPMIAYTIEAALDSKVFDEVMVSTKGKFFSLMCCIYPTAPFITPDTVAVVMPEEKMQDIDNLSGWYIAELKYKAFILKGGE